MSFHIVELTVVLLQSLNRLLCGLFDIEPFLFALPLGCTELCTNYCASLTPVTYPYCSSFLDIYPHKRLTHPYVAVLSQNSPVGSVSPKRRRSIRSHMRMVAGMGR